MAKTPVRTLAEEQQEAFARLKGRLETIELQTDFRSISTGVLAIDAVTGGGLPEGRLTEIYGDFSSGKSAIVYQSIAEVQRLGGVAMLHDSEGALNEPWAQSLGIDLNRLFYYEPMTLEEMFQKMEEGFVAVREDEFFKDKPFLIAWDSVAATTAQDEDDKEAAKAYGLKEPIALRARIIGAALRRLTRKIRDSRVVMVFVNQMRDRPMVMFGEQEDTTGGRAIKFYSSLRLHLKKVGGRSGHLMDGATPIGQRCHIEVSKSKVCVPFREVNFEVYFNQGVPRMSGMLDLLTREGKVKHTLKSPWYAIGTRRFQASEFDERMFQELIVEGASDVQNEVPAGTSVEEQGGELRTGDSEHSDE